MAPRLCSGPMSASAAGYVVERLWDCDGLVSSGPDIVTTYRTVPLPPQLRVLRRFQTFFQSFWPKWHLYSRGESARF